MSGLPPNGCMFFRGMRFEPPRHGMTAMHCWLAALALAQPRAPRSDSIGTIFPAVSDSPRFRSSWHEILVTITSHSERGLFQGVRQSRGSEVAGY